MRCLFRRRLIRHLKRHVGSYTDTYKQWLGSVNIVIGFTTDKQMPLPNDSSLPVGVQIVQLPNGGIRLSGVLTSLLVTARGNYDWPVGTSAATSQATIIALENKAANIIASLNASGAHSIVTEVSDWGGNNANTQAKIASATPKIRTKMLTAIQRLLLPNSLAVGLDELSDLPGLRLVMATKVYRFCCPDTGAAVDRHASYFFNSLKILDLTGVHHGSTNFKREWANGEHTRSRLAIYNSSYHKRDRAEFTEVYLPLLRQVAHFLNQCGAKYKCAATSKEKSWRPADVEMAAYYWWARNGPR